MNDGEYIVGDPHHVGRIFAQQPIHLIDYQHRVTATMRLPVDLMAAPIAPKRAAARGDEVDRSSSVIGAPRVDIALEIDRFPRGPWLLIQIRDLRASRGLNQFAIFT